MYVTSYTSNISGHPAKCMLIKVSQSFPFLCQICIISIILKAFKLIQTIPSMHSNKCTISTNVLDKIFLNKQCFKCHKPCQTIMNVVMCTELKYFKIKFAITTSK